MRDPVKVWLAEGRDRGPRYYDGLNEALAQVSRMDLSALLAHIDGLWGRDALRYGDGIDQVRAEALRQTERDFTR